MPKSIYFSDQAYEQIVAAARACGFRVQRGRGSQLAQFVVMAANKSLHTDGGYAPANQPDPSNKPASVKKARSPSRR